MLESVEKQGEGEEADQEASSLCVTFERLDLEEEELENKWICKTA